MPASVSVSIALLEKAGQMLTGLVSITLVADFTFPREVLIGRFGGKLRWSYLMVRVLSAPS